MARERERGGEESTYAYVQQHRCDGLTDSVVLSFTARPNDAIFAAVAAAAAARLSML